MRLLTLGLTALALAQAAVNTYRDPAGRFTFEYPAAFGATSPGTDDGFQNRLRAIRFEHFPGRFGGEAVVRRGPVRLDLQAAGGLYDEITLQIFPDAARKVVEANLPPLTASTLCAALGGTSHVDSNLPAFQALKPQERAGIARVDAMGDGDPHVLSCRVTGDIVTFEKTQVAIPGAEPRHVFGAVRFLAGEATTFQIIGGGAAPGPDVLAALTAAVSSYK